MKSARKICVVTGSRAEYGLLYWVLRKLELSEFLDLDLVVTGMHLSSEFGLTYKQIESDGFSIIRKVDMLLSSDAAAGTAKSMGLGMIGFAEAFESLKPDMVLLLGDRFELLAAANAALVAAVPIAHIHGGEITSGAFDDAIRHSITKMAHLHFTATEPYRQRVIQLGEHPNTVFNVGAPGVENIHRLELLDKSETEKSIGLELDCRSLLVTWHPVTLEPGNNEKAFTALIEVLDDIDNVKLVFTKANADPEGRVINSMIDEYVARRSNKAVVHTSLGQKRYLSILKHVNGVIGNSSSGIIEAPTLQTGTINIGDRQQGRIRAESIIDCDPSKRSIKEALSILFSEEFQSTLESVENPHGGSDVSEQIIHVLCTYPLTHILKKTFYNLVEN